MENADENERPKNLSFSEMTANDRADLFGKVKTIEMAINFKSDNKTKFGHVINYINEFENARRHARTRAEMETASTQVKVLQLERDKVITKRMKEIATKKSEASSIDNVDVADIVDEFHAHCRNRNDDVTVDNLIEFMDSMYKTAPYSVKKQAIHQIEREASKATKEIAVTEKELQARWGKKGERMPKGLMLGDVSEDVAKQAVVMWKKMNPNLNFKIVKEYGKFSVYQA